MSQMKVLAIVMLLVLAMLACAQSAAPAPSITPTAAGPAKRGAASWQNDWDKLLTLGRSEGKLVIYSSLAESPSRALLAAVKNFGIDMESVPGNGAELVVKMDAERRAGIFGVDLSVAGTTTLALYKERGFLDPFEDKLFLPEVVDGSKWMDGKLPFVDKEKMMLTFLVHPGSCIVINTDLVKEDEIKSYRDLLAPKWKGQIVMYDPTIPGAGASFFNYNVMETMGREFAEQLAGQDITFFKDRRSGVEWVARGKYPIVIAPDINVLGEMYRAGAPLKFIIPVEGDYKTAGSGGLSLFNKAPHPNAAALFLNWLLTQEGQNVIAKAMPDQSKRRDVPDTYIDADRRMSPKITYLDGDQEEFIATAAENQKLAREIFNIKY